MREASLQLGYNPQFMSTIENQTIELKVKTLLDFCNMLEITPQDFFYMGDHYNKEDKNDYRAVQGAMGGTNLLLKFVIPIADTVVIDLGIGAGVNYSRYTDSETNEKVWQPYPGARFEFALSWLLGKHLMLGFKVDITYLILIAAIEPSFTVGYNF